MRTLRWAALLLLLVPAVAHADDHRADINLAFCYEKGSHIVGPRVALGLTLPVKINGKNLLSALADFSFNEFDFDGDREEKRRAFMGGVRLTIPTSKPHHKFEVHGLVGGVNAKDDGVSHDGIAGAFGGGWEYVPHPAMTQGESSHGWGVSVQLDVVIPKGQTDAFPRLSAGAIYRIEKK